MHQDTQGARQEVSLPSTPAAAAFLAAHKHLLAIGEDVALSFLDHRHIAQGLAESQHRSMAVIAVHRASEL